MSELDKVKDYVKYRTGEVPDAIRWLITEIEELREERGKWYDIIQSDVDKVKRYEWAVDNPRNEISF